MSKKILLSWLFMAILCLPVLAQIQEPVKFKTEWKSVSADEVEIVFTGKMEKGWHVYSTDLPEGVLFRLLSIRIRLKGQRWLEN